MIKLGRNILENMARYSKLPSLHNYGVYEEEAEFIRQAPKNMIVLGAADEEFSTEPIGIPYDGYQFNALIFGKKGSGKTSLLSLIAHQLHYRFHHPILWIDPAWEVHTQNQRQPNPMLRARLKDYGLSSKGLPLFICAPQHCIEEGDENLGGYSFVFDLIDFKKIKKKDVRFRTMLEFFNIEDRSPPARQLMEYREQLPDTFDEFIEILEENRVRTQVLEQTLKAFSMGGAIGKGNRVHIPRIMEQPNGEKKVVILQLSTEFELTTASYLKMILLSIVSDRKSGKKGSTKSFLKTPPVVMLDEADVYADNYGSRPTIDRFSTKHRKLDIFNIAATQKPQYISRKVLGETDYIITSKLFQTEEKAVLVERGMNESDVENIFKDLKWDKNNPVKEHALIKSSGEYETFFPLPSPTKMFVEKRSKMAT